MGLLICYVLFNTFTFISGEHGIVPNVASSEKTRDAPWMVSLQLEKGDRAYCGATMLKSNQVGLESLISNHNHSGESLSKINSETITYMAHCSGWILTAASCTQKIPSSVFATLGNYDLEKEDTHERQWLIKNEDIYTHPEFNPITYENDIALINVKFNLTTEDDSEKAKTLCQSDIPVLRHWGQIFDTNAPNSHYFKSYAYYYVYGWGLRTENGPLQKELHFTKVPYLSDDTCFDFYGPVMYKPESMMCAGGNGHGTGACSYDTGGPLTCAILDSSLQPIRNETYVCGITSFGHGCGQNNPPAVFTYTGSFSLWIWLTTNGK